MLINWTEASFPMIISSAQKTAPAIARELLFCLLVSCGDVDDPAGDDEAGVLDFAYVCLHDGVYGGVILSCEVPKAIASLYLVLDHVSGGLSAGDLDQFFLVNNHHGFVHHCYYPPFFVCALWRSFLSYTYIYEGLTGMATKR